MTADDWAQFDAYLEGKRRLLEKRKQNPYVIDLIRVLWPHTVRGLARMDAINEVYRLRHPKGLATARAFEDTVQGAYNQHNKDSAVCKGRRKMTAPFYSVSRGVWGIDRRKAIEWMEKRERLLAPSDKTIVADR